MLGSHEWLQETAQPGTWPAVGIQGIATRTAVKMFVVLGVPPWPGSGEKAGATQPTFKGRGMRLNLCGKESQKAMGRHNFKAAPLVSICDEI